MRLSLWNLLLLLGLIGTISALPAANEDEETREKRHLRLAVNKYINFGGSPPIRKKIIGYNWNKIVLKNTPVQYQHPIFCLEYTPEQLTQLSVPPSKFLTTSPLLKLPPAPKIVPLYRQSIQIPSPPKLFYQIPEFTKIKSESVLQTQATPTEDAPSTDALATVYEAPVAPTPAVISTVYGPPAQGIQGFPILQQPALAAEPILDLPSPPESVVPASEALVEIKSPSPTLEDTPAPVPVFSFEQVIGGKTSQPIPIIQSPPKPIFYHPVPEPLPQFNYIETPKPVPVVINQPQQIVSHFKSSADCLETPAQPPLIPYSSAGTIPVGYPQNPFYIQETPASTFPLNLQPQPAFQAPLATYKEEISALNNEFIAAKYPEFPASTYPLNFQPQPVLQSPPEYIQPAVPSPNYVSTFPETPASTYSVNFQPQPIFQSPLEYIQPAAPSPNFVSAFPQTPASTYPVNFQPQPVFKSPPEYIQPAVPSPNYVSTFPETPASTYSVNFQPQPIFQSPPEYIQPAAPSPNFVSAFPETPASTYPVNFQPQPVFQSPPEYIQPAALSPNYVSTFPETPAGTSTFYAPQQPIDDGSLPINPIVSPAGTIPADFSPQYQPIPIPTEIVSNEEKFIAPATVEGSSSFSTSGVISPAGTIPLGGPAIPIAATDEPVFQEVPQVLQPQENIKLESGSSVIQCYQCSPISFVPEGQQSPDQAAVEEKIFSPVLPPSPPPVLQNIELPKFDYPYPPNGVKF